MGVQVLVSAMHQKNLDLIRNCNIQTSAVIINQCNEEGYLESTEGKDRVVMFSTKERGLSRSRNMALEKATEDICIICDEDVKYVDGYGAIVEEAFRKLKDADIIVFNIKPVNSRNGEEERIFTTIKRVPRFKTYGSVHIAFRRTSVLEAGLRFNENFGSGSGIYPMSEDSIFFVAAHKAGLKAYTYPECIASVDFSKSSWFHGYDEKYFYDIGAFLAEAYPVLKGILKWYYPVRMRNLSELSTRQIIHAIRNGMNGYRSLIRYEDYKKEKR